MTPRSGCLDGEIVSISLRKPRGSKALSAASDLVRWELWREAPTVGRANGRRQEWRQRGHGEAIAMPQGGDYGGLGSGLVV